MISITDDSILVFEYYTASGEKDQCITSEAEAIILSLVEDLKDFNIYLVLHESYNNFVEDRKNVVPIFIKEKLDDWLKNNANQFKRAIFIASEENNNLYNLTKILEDNGVKLYTSSSQACFDSSDKFTTYEKLYGTVPQPRTFRIKIDSKGYWKRAIENLYKQWKSEDPFSDLKLILKPLIGVDCENIKVLDNIDELSFELEDIFPPGSRILVQEYIEGEDVSVSLISDGKIAVPLSLNKQFVEIKNNKGRYLGGMLPLDSEFKQEAFKIAKKAVESIEGMKGFVGVDLKINKNSEDVYDVFLLEVNSRFTTPYVGLSKVVDFNIGKSIVNILDGKMSISDLENNVFIKGNVVFKKQGNNLNLEINQ